MIDLNTLLENVFFGAFTIIGACFVYIFNEARGDLKALKDSVQDLNKQMAVIIEKTTGHEKRIDDLEDKVFKK